MVCTCFSVCLCWCMCERMFWRIRCCTINIYCIEAPASILLPLNKHLENPGQTHEFTLSALLELFSRRHGLNQSPRAQYARFQIHFTAKGFLSTLCVFTPRPPLGEFARATVSSVRFVLKCSSHCCPAPLMADMLDSGW